MRRKDARVLFLLLVIFSFIYVKSGFCYRIPPKETQIRYLYVFGRDGKDAYGAIKTPQVVFLRVPVSYSGEVKISIYDPDVGGAIDEKSGRWDTETRFSIFGGDRAYSSLAGKSEINIVDFFEGVLLDVETFGKKKTYDRKFYHFSDIDVLSGEQIGEFRYFKIIAEGLSGDDNNIFSMEVSPDVVEAFSYTLSIRLSDRRGSKMALYPEIPSGAMTLIEHNYDLDKSGGDIDLISALKSYKIKGSYTGGWADTAIEASRSETGKRWVYEITKGTQPNANMAMYLTTGGGDAIPVFFTPGKGGPKMAFIEDEPKEETIDPTVSCRTFTFDASRSYDPDNQEIKYFWDFGDGTTSSEIRSAHTYREAGKYLVELKVADDSEADCNSATTKYIVRVNEPPQVIAKGIEFSCVGTEVSFDGTQSLDSPEDALAYLWDFGDGNKAEGAKVRHKYEQGGDYQVVLEVKDDSGSACDTGMDRLNVMVNTAPVADAGGDFLLCSTNPNDFLEVTFDASGSTDADQDSLTYLWDFGDGQTASGKVVTRKYELGGEYSARLLVSDNTDTSCNSSETSKRIILNRSPLASAGGNVKICLSETADFDATRSFDRDGDPISCTWDFGDGKTGKGLEVSHIYEKGGLYKVELGVDDNSGTECSMAHDMILVEVNSIPEAGIKADENTCIDKDVDFDGTSSADADGDALQYAWDFGDGTTARGAAVKHAYTEGGLYKVILSVDDGKDSNCSISEKAHYININTPPVAEAGPDKLVCINKTIEFDALKSFDRDNDSLSYVWDFGDGQTAVGQKVQHTYKEIGIYKVVLSVTDDSGTECNISVDTMLASVNAEPVPIIEVL